MFILHTFIGAQSDSELSTAGNQSTTDGGDRGYTSDSELYDTQNRRETKSSSTMTTETKPTPSSHGSWLLVRSSLQEIESVFMLIFISLYSGYSFSKKITNYL